MPKHSSGAEPVVVRFAAALLTRRGQLGMSRAECARRAGLSRVHLRHLELGLAAPSLLTMSRLAEALACRIDDLLK